MFLFKILSEFYEQTNIPVLINTSFNIGGEAIVNTIEDAINSFLRMDIDYLIIDKFIISKNEDFPKNKISVNDFIKNRQKKFIKQNLLPSYRISYYNSNFYINFKSFIKKKLKEIFYIKYYL